MLIRIGQGRSLGSLNHSQVLESSPTAGQSSSYLSERLRIAYLAEQHRHKLVPTRKASGMPFRFRLLHFFLKFAPWKNLEQLVHDAAKSHGAEPPVRSKVFAHLDLLQCSAPSGPFSPSKKS